MALYVCACLTVRAGCFARVCGCMAVVCGCVVSLAFWLVRSALALWLGCVWRSDERVSPPFLVLALPLSLGRRPCLSCLLRSASRRRVVCVAAAARAFGSRSLVSLCSCSEYAARPGWDVGMALALCVVCDACACARLARFVRLRTGVWVTLSVCACRTVRSRVVLRVFVGCMPGVCGCGFVGRLVGSVGARAVLGLRLAF